jgi:hypothetical protein
MASQVIMVYPYNTSIDSVLAVGSKLRYARDVVSEAYAGAECIVSQFRSHEYQVTISAKNGTLEQAVHDYVSLAGAPSYVEDGSNYRAMIAPLRQQGLKLKRGLAGLLYGKDVVPA